MWHATLLAIQGVSLVYDMPAVHRIVQGDEQAVKRIVMNLVRQATLTLTGHNCHVQ
jgi:hypothetical protein